MATKARSPAGSQHLLGNSRHGVNLPNAPEGQTLL